MKRLSILAFFIGVLLGSYYLFAGVSGVAVRTVYSSTNVGTSSWVVLIPSTPLTTSSISVADTSGQVMEIGMCPVGSPTNSEVRQFLIPAGGTAVNIQIPSNQRVSIRAVSSSASTGENDLNVLF